MHDLSTWTMNQRSEFIKNGLRIVQTGFRNYEVYNHKGKYIATERTLYRAMSKVESLIKIYNENLLKGPDYSLMFNNKVIPFKKVTFQLFEENVSQSFTFLHKGKSVGAIKVYADDPGSDLLVTSPITDIFIQNYCNRLSTWLSSD